MIRLNAFILSFAWFVLFYSQLSGQQLSEVLQTALKQNKEVQAQQQALQSAQLQAEATFRKTLPSLDLNASYRHVTHVAQLQFPSTIPIPGFPSDISLGQYDTYESGLTLKYVLFSGFAQKNQVKLMNQQAGLANISLEDKQKEIAFKVIGAYRQVQAKQLELEALQASLKRIELQIKRVKALVRQGMALGLDTLSLKLARLNVRKQLISARGDLEIVQQQLDQLVGGKVQVPPFQKPESLALNVLPVVQLMTPYRLLDQQQQMQHTMVKISKARYLPSLAAFASYNYGKPGLDFVKGEWMDYGIWGLSLSWNLFSWQADRLNEQAARAQVKKIEYQKDAVKDQLQTRFENALREWQTLKEQEKVVQTALSVAQQKMKIVQSRYQQGMASATDFNEANLQLTESELNLKRHYLLMVLKLNEIDYLSGKPLNQWSIL